MGLADGAAWEKQYGISEQQNKLKKQIKVDNSINYKEEAIEAFKKACPCWSRFEQDRKCYQCDYLKQFIDSLNQW